MLHWTFPTQGRADGEYWGFDFSESTASGVLSASRGELIFGAGVTDYDGGVSLGLSLSRSLPYTFGVEGLQLSAGAGLGFSYDDEAGDFSDPEFGLTASVQRFRPTEFGSIFWQASFSSISLARFAQLQYGLDEPGLTLAVSYGASTEYEETTISVSKRLGDSPISLRTGWRVNAGELFLGFAVNTF
jgi:hypothetical protein